MVDIPANIIEFKNDLEEKEMLINFNKQREKTYSQKYNEAKLLEEIESEKAEQRKLLGKKQDKCNHTQTFAEGCKTIDLKPNIGETKKVVAEKTGFGSKENSVM